MINNKTKNGRIDFHRHIFAPPYVAQLKEQNIGVIGWSERTSPDSTLEDMDQGGVTTAILSTPWAPSEVAQDPGTLRQYCRVNNDFVAGLMAEFPDRFGLFASLPMPDIRGSIDEIKYAFDVLGADGVRMNTNCGNLWIADTSFTPVLEELNHRRAVVYTHPITPFCCNNILPDLAVTEAIIEYGTDTARALLQIVFGGAAARFPNITWIFSHAGGTMPALVERFINLAASPRFAPQFPNGFMEVASGFYYDTAQATNRAAMSALNAVVPDSQILFGTDFPWRTTKHQVESLESCGVFRDDQLRAIDYGNAMRLLPRLTIV